jgi:hypothetical protein
LLGLAIASAACAPEAFTTQVASGFAPGHHIVSVFGVYKDGQMSSGAWDAIEPRIAHALGAPRCEAGYTDALAGSHGVLSAAIEDYARADGPTDDLLAQIAPAATGDLILVVTFAGKLPAHEAADAHQDAPAIGGGAGAGRGGMRGGGGGPRGPMAPHNTDELDLSATLFSVARSQSVAVVSLRYLGTSVDEAVSQLAAKLADSVPGAACAGWNWDAKVDPEAIRRLDQ